MSILRFISVVSVTDVMRLLIVIGGASVKFFLGFIHIMSVASVMHVTRVIRVIPPSPPPMNSLCAVLALYIRGHPDIT